LRFYGGHGDRHQQNGVNYTLDLNPSTRLRAGSGLTQVLSDGTNTYLYGNGRISQFSIDNSQLPEYFLGDALGSVRQLADTAGAVTLTQNYAPYGETISSVGSGASVYQFTGESRDANGLTYLRARYLDSSTGRFTQRDPSGMESNLYLYAGGDPVNRIDPTGLFSKEQITNSFGVNTFADVMQYYDTNGEHWGFLAALLHSQPGDLLFAEHVQIQPFSPPYKTGRGYFVGYSEQGITLNGMPLNAVYRSNNINNPTAGLVENIWRGSDPIYYSILNSHKQQYVDSPLSPDLPDFWAVSVSAYVIQGLYMVDRFGHAYITGGLSFSTSDAGAAYVEGYVSIATGYPGGSDYYLPEEILFDRLVSWGGCFSGEAALFIGISGAACMNQTFMVMYSAGLQVTAGVGVAPYTWDMGQKKIMGWNWAIEDMKRGVKRSDLDAMSGNIFGDCNDQLLHLNLPSIGN